MDQAASSALTLSIIQYVLILTGRDSSCWERPIVVMEATNTCSILIEITTFGVCFRFSPQGFVFLCCVKLVYIGETGRKQ